MLLLDELRGIWISADAELDALTRDNSPYIYVYTFCDVPRYVGKGTGRRWRAHRGTKSHLGNALRKHRAEHGNWLLPTMCRVDNDKAALEEEVRLIAGFGRGDLGKGPLWNLTDGGEGASGVLISASRMEKITANAADPLVNRKRALTMTSNWDDLVYRAKMQVAQRKNDRVLMLEKLSAGVSMKLAARELNIPYPTLAAFRTQGSGKKRTKFRPPTANRWCRNRSMAGG